MVNIESKFMTKESISSDRSNEEYDSPPKFPQCIEQSLKDIPKELGEESIKVSDLENNI